MTAHLRRIGPGRYSYDDARWPSVTTIIGDGIPKPALKQWAANEAASYAIENYDELRAMPILKALDAIRYAHARRTRTAATRGTDIHAHGAALVNGEPVDVPDELLGPVKAYARFLETWGIAPIAVETPLANTVHRYAGTADLWCTIAVRDGGRALVDLKAGAGVWPEVALQLAAYRYADVWQPDGPTSENTDVPDVDLVYVAHILPDDVEMIPVVATPAQHRVFLYAQQVARWMNSVKTDRDGNVDFPVVLPAEQP